MPSTRIWVLLNLSLGIVAVLLLLQFFGISLPTVGKAQYWLDREEPRCFVNWKEEYSPLADLDRCCLLAGQQFGCIQKYKELPSGRMDFVCETGSNTVNYWLNAKAYRYCQQQVFWR